MYKKQDEYSRTLSNPEHVIVSDSIKDIVGDLNPSPAPTTPPVAHVLIDDIKDDFIVFQYSSNQKENYVEIFCYAKDISHLFKLAAIDKINVVKICGFGNDKIINCYNDYEMSLNLDSGNPTFRIKIYNFFEE
tara:strand:- start:883 stop:1281 length:399 start_codon:yes stop_codon:yes gene_type:complete